MTGRILTGMLCAAGIAGLACPPAAEADTILYGVTWLGDFVQIDKSTGAAAVIGKVGYGSLNSMAVDSHGRLFASGNTANKLIEIDPTTGEGAVKVQFTGMPSGYNPRGLAFDADDNLYAVLSQQSLGEIDLLARIDVETGAVTVIGETGRKDLQGLDFGPDGVLYGAAVYAGLASLDVESGAVVDIIGDDGFDPDDQTLEFDVDGTLYAAQYNLQIVDPFTGEGTVVGDLGTASSVRGLAIIPEPATLLMLVVLGGLASTRRR